MACLLVIKLNTDGEVEYKARYVVGRHPDNLKHYFVHRAQTLQASSARLLITLASENGFEVWSSDVKLVYLQSGARLARRSFTKKAASEFEFEREQKN